MAKPFSIPAIPQLYPNESFVVQGGTRADVSRKVKGYASRCKPPKAFHVASEGEYGVRVTRLPDPEPQP